MVGVAAGSEVGLGVLVDGVGELLVGDGVVAYIKASL